MARCGRFGPRGGGGEVSAPAIDFRTARIKLGASQLGEAIDAVTAVLMERHLWPKDLDELTTATPGRFVTATDLLDRAATIVWQASQEAKTAATADLKRR